MSSKVFEYLQAGRPVFAISPAGSAARALFAEVGGGTCVLPDDQMAAPLAAFVRAARDGQRPARRPGGPGALRAGRLTAELAALLDGLAAGSLRPPPVRRSAPSPLAGPPDRAPPPDHARLPRAGRRRFTRTDAALLAAGAALTVVFVGSPHAPTARGLGRCWSLLAAVAADPAEPRALARAGRRRAPRGRPRAAVPAAALLGPSFALPALPAGSSPSASSWPSWSPSASRGCVVRRAPLPFAAKDVAAAARALVRLALRRPSPGRRTRPRPALPRLVVTMIAARGGHGGRRHAAAAASAASASPWSSPTPSIVGVTVLEARLGIRLPTSRLIDGGHLADLRRDQRLPQPERPRHLSGHLLAVHALRLLLHAPRCAGWALAVALHRSSAPPPSCAPARAPACVAAGVSTHRRRRPLLAPRRAALDAPRQDRRRRGRRRPGGRRRLPAVQRLAERHAAPVPPGGAAQPGAGRQGLRRDPQQPDEPWPGDRRRQLPSRRRPRPGRGHHLVGHRRARHLQPAQLVVRDLRRRRPAGLRPSPDLLPVPGDRPVAHRAARPGPVHALPGQRHRARPDRLRSSAPLGPSSVGELRPDVDPVRTRAGRDLARAAGGGRGCGRGVAPHGAGTDA